MHDFQYIIRPQKIEFLEFFNQFFCWFTDYGQKKSCRIFFLNISFVESVLLRCKSILHLFWYLEHFPKDLKYCKRFRMKSTVFSWKLTKPTWELMLDSMFSYQILQEQLSLLQNLISLDRIQNKMFIFLFYLKKKTVAHRLLQQFLLAINPHI